MQIRAHFPALLICPVGQSAHTCHAQIARRANLSQPVGIAVTPKSAPDFALSRLDKRDASRSSRTLRRDAVDAAVSLTSGTKADGEVVWSWRPDAGAKLAERSANDGGKRARSPGRARRKPLKPLRREGRTVSVNLWRLRSYACFNFACEAAGATGTRLSLRPLFSSRAEALV